MPKRLHERLTVDQIAGGLTVAATLSGIASKTEPTPGGIKMTFYPPEGTGGREVEMIYTRTAMDRFRVPLGKFVMTQIIRVQNEMGIMKDAA